MRKRDMTVIYKLMMSQDYLDGEDLLLWDTREMRGHGMKLKNTCRRDIKMKSSCKEAWTSGMV